MDKTKIITIVLGAAGAGIAATIFKRKAAHEAEINADNNPYYGLELVDPQPAPIGFLERDCGYQ